MRRTEITYICEGCHQERVAFRVPTDDGNFRYLLPAGWVRISTGAAAAEPPAPLTDISGEYCSVECLSDVLLEGGIANETKDS